jgi:hypothetical protein
VLTPLGGSTCSGDWTKLTFGSTGSMEIAFPVSTAGDGGVVTATLSGNVVGAAGGTVELPLSLQGDNTVIDDDENFLGAVKMTFNADGGLLKAMFDAPLIFGTADSKVTLEYFAFDGATMTSGVKIDFGAGASTVESVFKASCS